MGMESTLKNSILTTIFVISIITFAVLFAIDNDSDITLANDSRYTTLSGNLQTDSNSFANDSESSKEILDATTIASGDSEISGAGGQFKVGPFTAVGMVLKSFKTSFDVIFGDSFIFIFILFASLFIMLIGYYVIKAWLGRDPS